MINNSVKGNLFSFQCNFTEMLQIFLEIVTVYNISKERKIRYNPKIKYNSISCFFYQCFIENRKVLEVFETVTKKFSILNVMFIYLSHRGCHSSSHQACCVLCVNMCVNEREAHMCHGACMEVRGQLCLLLPTLPVFSGSQIQEVRLLW